VVNLALLRLLNSDTDLGLTVVADLDRALNAWSLRVDSELRAGASDALRSYLGSNRALHDLTVSAALEFPDHVDLGARALLMTKGIAGETDAALARLIAENERAEVRKAAESLRRAEGMLHTSYQTNEPERIAEARQGRDAARRELFQAVDPPLAYVPETIVPSAVASALSDGTVFLDYGIYSRVDFSSRSRSGPRIVVAAYRMGEDVQLLDLGLVSNIIEPILATTLYKNRTKNLRREHWILRETLLDPVEDMLKEAKEVIIAPDGILTRVNFALLQDTEDHNSHLIERLPVRIAPNGRSLIPQPSAPPAPDATFLGAGLTEFGPHDPVLCGRAPTRSSVGGLCPLPNAVDEIERITHRFDTAGQSIRPPLLDADATEAAVTTAMPGTRVIHLATHGGALLAGTDGAGLHNVGLAFHGFAGRAQENRIITADNDGILSGYEAARIPLWGTDLAVLSACDTALGEAAGSEGIWSMAHAFRLAGANAVLMTLWSVSDESAPDFMDRFYQTLLERQDRMPDEPVRTTLRTALRDTRLWAIRQGWSYWHYGPFVLVEN